MKYRHILLLPVFFLLVCSFIYAKNVIVKLHDGTEIPGTIIKVTDSKVVLKTIAGTKVIRRSDIKSVKSAETNTEKYNKELAKRDMTKADSHYEMAMWCLNNNMKMYYFTHLNKAIEIDPCNEKAHKALGHVPYEKKWVDDQGKVQRKIIWVTEERKKYLVEQERKKAAKIKGTDKDQKDNNSQFGPVILPHHDPLTDDERSFIMRYVNDLGSNNWRNRSRAINTILQQEFTHKMPPLIVNVLKTGSPNAKVSAMEILLKMNYAPALELIHELALNDNSTEVKKQAAFLLGNLGGPKSARILIKLLDDKDKNVVAEAIAALEKLTFITLDYLGEPDVAKARSVFRGWVSKNGKKTRKEVLEEMACKGEPRNRIQACKFLFNMGEIKALYNLVKLLLHEDHNIQAEANRMLMKLTDEDFLFDHTVTNDDLKRNWASNWDAHIAKLIRKAEEKKTTQYKSDPKISSAPDIIRALDGTRKDRDEARDIIKAMAKTKAIPLLINALNSNNFFIRTRAFNLLKEITGMEKGLGYDPGESSETIRLVFINKWKQWFAQNKHTLEDKSSETKQQEE